MENQLVSIMGLGGIENYTQVLTHMARCEQDLFIVVLVLVA
jgi:hypothetical protein